MKRRAETYTENKKRRLDSLLLKSARYPLSFIFSSMVHRQSPLCLTNSSQGVIVATPPRPNPASVYCVSGDMYTLNDSKSPFLSSTATIKKASIRAIEKYHKQHTITHLIWNQKGTTLASADETGKLALWNLENSVQSWSLAYEVDLMQPLAALLWLNAEREYTPHQSDKDCIYVKEKILGPRNPFGYLGFVAVTVHGEISVHYQRNGAIFSTFSTTIPKSGHRDTSRADTGCYGMALAGLDDWQRMSHASLTLDKDGNMYLATYYSECLPKTVYLYNIIIKFPGKSDAGAIFCQSSADLQFITAPESALASISQPETAVTQVALSNSSQGVILHVCFGEHHEDNYTGYYGKWILQQTTQQVPSSYFDGNDFGDDVIRREKVGLNYLSGFILEHRFVTSISCHHSGQLALGLSDGSVHMESQDRADIGLVRHLDSNQSYPNFWQVIGPHTLEDGFSDPVFGITFSSNGTHLFHMLSSGRIGSARVTEDAIREDSDEQTGTIMSLERAFKLSLLNQTDDLDLISELVRISKLQKDKDIPELVVNSVLTAYESFFYQCDMNHLQATPDKDVIKPSEHDDWNLGRTRPAYGFAIGAFRYLTEKRVQFINLTKALQLPVILECFMGSCSSDFIDLLNVLDLNTDDQKANALSFHPDSLWSLLSLSNWVFDYVRWILKEWNVLFNRRYPKSAGKGDLSSRPVHAVLLIHKESRISLMKILRLIQHFIQFAKNAQYELQHIPETKSLLLRHISATLTSEPVAINDVISFLQDLDRIKELDDSVFSSNSNAGYISRWSILVSSRLPTGETMDHLRRVTAQYQSKCALPAIYLETHQDYPIDVIRKKRIRNPGAHLQSCIRCRQLYLPELPNTVDPTTFSSWFHSLTRRCVCGGLFF